MTKEPVDLSDWIQFLNGKINRRTTFILTLIPLTLAILTSSLVLLSVFLHAISLGIPLEGWKLEITLYTITGTIIILTLTYFFELFCKRSIANRAADLLKEIMQSKEIEVDYVWDRWFNWKKYKVKKKIKKENMQKTKPKKREKELEPEKKQ